MKEKLAGIVFILIVLSSCVNEAEFKGKYTDPLLVVNAIAEVGEPLSVEVTESRFFLGSAYDTFPKIKDAIVSLNINGESQILQYDGVSNRYVSDGVINFNDSLDLEVEARGKKAKASIRVISAVVSLADVELTTGESHFDYYIADNDTLEWAWYVGTDATLTFADPAQEHNYYMLKYRGIYYYDNQTFYADTYSYILWNFQDMYKNVGDISDLLDNLLGTADPRILDDAVNNGTSIEASVNTYFETDSQLPAVGLDSVVAEYRLCSIDRHLYLYSQTAYQFRTSDGLELFVEPTQIYNNISGGVGIFASQGANVRRVKIWEKTNQ